MAGLRVFLILGLFVAAPAAWAAPGVIEGAARVVDGDTLAVAGRTVRLFGIDAPEAGQTCDLAGKPMRCGDFATAQLRAAVARDRVSCRVKVEADRHGRPVAMCTAGGRDLGQAMVRAGAAVAYLRYSDRYAADEAQARADRRGLWQARMVTPEAERGARRPAAPPAQETCAIKGNITAKGERIYHLPGQRYYDRTQIGGPGERMFCSEAEARAAGFRRSRI